MTDYKVSYRYATSLLETAEEKKLLEIIAQNIQLVKNTLKENPELLRILKNPVIKSHVKISILEEIFGSKIDNETLNFLKFVIHKNRENSLFNILQKFVELYDQKLEIVNVEVKTAFEFDDDQKRLLKDKLEKYLNKNTRIWFTLR